MQKHYANSLSVINTGQQFLFLNMKENIILYDLHVRGIEGLSSLEGIQIFWILFCVSSLGIPLGWRKQEYWGKKKKKTPAPGIPKMWFRENKHKVKK